VTTRTALRLAWRVAYNLLLALVVVYMLAPSVVVAVLSFSSDAFIKFPPKAWGLRQYETLFASGEWLTPLLRSLLVAAITAVLATLIGLAAVLALNRTRVPGGNVVQMLGVGPLLAPAVAYAVALYTLFSSLSLLGTSRALILAHVTMAVPFVLLIAGSAITRVPRDLELAALSLGAGRFHAWRDITLRLLAPALAASLIFGFVTSFDEAVVASFLGYETLPVAIFNSVRYGVDPVITAISTLLTIGTGLLLSLYLFLDRRAR
jgi:ABC-type spermidine/putrescine transport system permease subunit II